MLVDRKLTHGGARPSELRALGIHPDAVIDFSASVSPLGPPPVVREALAQLDLAAYPDPDCTHLREALAARDGVSPEQLLVGNGAVELIHLLAQAYLRPSDAAAIFAPAFGEYRAACRRQAARMREVRAEEDDDFTWRLAEALDQLGPARLIFLGNPNNPTGSYLDRHEVTAISRAGDGLLVLDEAYRSFVDAPWESTSLVETAQVVLLRSLTKDYGLAGLRLGYAIGPVDIIRRLRTEQVSWSVNAAAQAAGLAALADPEYLEHVRRVVREAKASLCAALVELGLTVVAGVANFVLVKVGNAREVRLRLLRQGILVRDCTSFGLPTHIRIGVRTQPECERLVVTLAGVLEVCRADG